MEKKYLASTPELNTVALARLRYIPSVQLAEESVHICRARNESREDAFAGDRYRGIGETSFHASSDGVTDDWIKTIEVEKIAGGRFHPTEDIRLIAALIQKDSGDSCCRRKMFDQPDQDAPNLADPEAPCLSRKLVADQPHQ